MKIATYNVNGIRAALSKGLLEWVARGNYDVICLQEVKANEEQVELEGFTDLGYEWAWRGAEKKGYSGVATFWKKGLHCTEVNAATCFTAHDELHPLPSEGRILRNDFAASADMPAFSVVNIYFPSGSSGDARQASKMDFLHELGQYLACIRAQQPNIIVVGDYNIAHTPMDIHNPKSNKNSAGFLPDERAWLSGFLAGGMVDAFRALHPNVQEYSWWSFRGGARANNKGWRIDYQMLSETLRPYLCKAYHLPDDKHSDHCAVVVEYNNFQL